MDSAQAGWRLRPGGPAGDEGGLMDWSLYTHLLRSHLCRFAGLATGPADREHSSQGAHAAGIQGQHDHANPDYYQEALSEIRQGDHQYRRQGNRNQKQRTQEGAEH